ncbi:hypothetical protein ACFYUD_36095 [Nocardia tengchongensis]|uniref:hypothetical protein n=1 Tax=Nocardia tengchongensis TaxID=2055889 RepID=UPI00369474DA
MTTVVLTVDCRATQFSEGGPAWPRPRHGGDILVGTAKHPWVSNIRKGVPLEVSFGGSRLTADAEVLADEESVVRLSEAIARDNKQWAKFNGMGFDADGNPNRADAYQSWQQGTVILRLTVP